MDTKDGDIAAHELFTSLYEVSHLDEFDRAVVTGWLKDIIPEIVVFMNEYGIAKSDLEGVTKNGHEGSQQQD